MIVPDQRTQVLEGLLVTVAMVGEEGSRSHPSYFSIHYHPAHVRPSVVVSRAAV